MSCCKTRARLDASRLLNHVWGEDYALEEHALDVHIHPATKWNTNPRSRNGFSRSEALATNFPQAEQPNVGRLEGTNYPVAESATWFYIGNRA